MTDQPESTNNDEAAAPTGAHQRRNPPAPKLWTMADLRDAIERFNAMLEASEISRATRFHYVDHSTRFLNWLEGNYTPRTKKPGAYGWSASGNARSKYAPLRAYLKARDEQNAIHLTFRRIEEILGTALPSSARRYHHWWANDSTGNHTQALAWLTAGRRVVELNLLEQRVMFIRADRDYRGGKVRYLPTPAPEPRRLPADLETIAARLRRPTYDVE